MKTSQKYINEVEKMLVRLADISDETAVADAVNLSRKIAKSRVSQGGVK